MPTKHPRIAVTQDEELSDALDKVAALTGEDRYREAAERALATVTPFLTRYPTGFANWLSAAELAVGGIVELAIVGDPTAADTRALLGPASAGGRRDLVIAVAACSLVALNEGFLPPTINLATPDPECDLDYVPNAARPARVGLFLSNSFAFGGMNGVVAVRTLHGL